MIEDYIAFSNALIKYSTIAEEHAIKPCRCWIIYYLFFRNKIRLI